MSNLIVKAENLTKIYSSMPALDGLNLELERGQLIGLLGPNGSGKTTLIKLLAGLLTPSFGEVRINGMLPSPETKAIVSYLPERTYFDSGMTVSETVEFFVDFYSDFDAQLAIKILTDFKIDPKAKIKTLSKGTKEKLQLALVMSRRAQLYLLDEPIAGVDPSAREYILNTVISTYNKEATVIISTHLIADVEKVIDRAIFLSEGKLVLDADVNELREEHGKSLDEYFREVFKCSLSS